MRNVLAHAGNSNRRVVSAFIATAFAKLSKEFLGSEIVHDCDVVGLEHRQELLLDVGPKNTGR